MTLSPTWKVTVPPVGSAVWKAEVVPAVHSVYLTSGPRTTLRGPKTWAFQQFARALGRQHPATPASGRGRPRLGGPRRRVWSNACAPPDLVRLIYIEPAIPFR